jgi:hypothetical protein
VSWKLNNLVKFVTVNRSSTNEVHQVSTHPLNRGGLVNRIKGTWSMLTRKADAGALPDLRDVQPQFEDCSVNPAQDVSTGDDWSTQETISAAIGYAKQVTLPVIEIQPVSEEEEAEDGLQSLNEEEVLQDTPDLEKQVDLTGHCESVSQPVLQTWLKFDLDRAHHIPKLAKQIPLGELFITTHDSEHKTYHIYNEYGQPYRFQKTMESIDSDSLFQALESIRNVHHQTLGEHLGSLVVESLDKTYGHDKSIKALNIFLPKVKIHWTEECSQIEGAAMAMLRWMRTEKTNDSITVVIGKRDTENLFNRLSSKSSFNTIVFDHPSFNDGLTYVMGTPHGLIGEITLVDPGYYVDNTPSGDFCVDFIFPIEVRINVTHMYRLKSHQDTGSDISESKSPAC